MLRLAVITGVAGVGCYRCLDAFFAPFSRDALTSQEVGVCCVGRSHCVKFCADVRGLSEDKECLSSGGPRGVQCGKQIQQDCALDLGGDLCRWILRSIHPWTAAGEV